MEWDDLKHFLAVARSGSLTDAARRLKTTPATVGRRVAALESKLGTRLFDRTRNGYLLNESGAPIRLKAEEVEQAVLSLERAAVGHDLQPTGTVRITTPAEVAALMIAPRLAEFRRRFPGISLEVTAIGEVLNLTRREADVALRTIRPKDGNLVIRRAGSWRYGLYAAKSYAQARGLRPGLTKLSKLEIITATKEMSRFLGASWFVKHAPGATIALATNTRGMQYAACRAGVGVAILPSLLGDPDPDLVRLLPPERVISEQLWLVVHRDLVRTARVRAVIDFLAEVCARATPMQQPGRPK